MYKILLVLWLVVCVGVACSEDDPLAPSATKGTVTIVGTLTDHAGDDATSIRLRIEYGSITNYHATSRAKAVLTGPVTIKVTTGSELMRAVAATLESKPMNLRYTQAPEGGMQVDGSMNAGDEDNYFNLRWLATYPGRLGGGGTVSLDDVFEATARMVVSANRDGEVEQLQGTDVRVSIRGTKALVDVLEGE